MASELIDEPELMDEFDSLEVKKRKNLVRIISGILFLMILSLSPFCYQEIINTIGFYCRLRDIIFMKMNVHGMVSSFFLASIPVIAYNVWFKSARRATVLGYLMLFASSFLLYIIVFAVGLELVFLLSYKVDGMNSLLAKNVLVPPISSAFDLLFILSALVSFLFLKWVYGKMNLPNHTNNK